LIEGRDMRPSEIKRAEAEKLKSMTDEYLAGGATISHIPTGYGVGSATQTTTQRHVQAKKKGRGLGITITPEKLMYNQ
jgi:hypothetical protein